MVANPLIQTRKNNGCMKSNSKSERSGADENNRNCGLKAQRGGKTYVPCSICTIFATFNRKVQSQTSIQPGIQVFSL